MSHRPHLELGYVSRAHGIRGEVAVKSFDPDSTSLQTVRRVILRRKDGSEQTLVIESVRPADKEFLVTFQGVSGRSEAEALRGATVLVFREDLPPPAEDEYFQGDLIGLLAFDPDGKALGTVQELWETGPVPNLVIRDEAGAELIVPFADPFVTTVDLAQGRVTVNPPELTE